MLVGLMTDKPCVMLTHCSSTTRLSTTTGCGGCNQAKHMLAEMSASGCKITSSHALLLPEQLRLCHQQLLW